ncbi:MAG: ATP-grasp domain-containing protein [Firmicutes bacterium]|nr:ATP-grasp domain-containing protein [Bacillota bacterium]
MFSKILIANRGEIAERIIRACKEMGIATVAVYSTADSQTLATALADEAVCIGPPPAGESYLNEKNIISAALLTGAQAIHPGYGFLSENAGFAMMCRKNGIVFIGPDPDTMQCLENKAFVKKIMKDAGLRVIEGTGVLKNETEAEAEAKRIGYPVMLKACAGGGGRGIYIVRSPEELSRIFPVASAEARAAFSDGTLYIEKYVYPARHIEVQILADEERNVICLGERDCSIKKRHQKLIEESPSPAVTDKMRAELFAAVTAAVGSIGYVGAGTLEFLLDTEGNFWFMEMNIRLQVEHGVTEILTRTDLVKWQIRTAAGIPIGMKQEDISIKGTALECRINAKETGALKSLHVPGGPFVRFDTCLAEGVNVTSYYDPLVGKLIVWSGTREEAIRKMRVALCELVIDGVETNIAEQLEIIGDAKFVKGDYNCSFMGDR